MGGSRFLSVIAGLIIGAFLGMFFYILIGYTLICGPLQSVMVPENVMKIWRIDILKYGLSPGVFIGFLGGLVVPFHAPRGHLSKSIGASTCLIVSILAWITQWYNLAETSKGRIGLAIGITFVAILIAIPVSGSLGFIEKIRER